VFACAWQPGTNSVKAFDTAVAHHVRVC